MNCDLCERPATIFIKDTFHVGIEIGQDGYVYELLEPGLPRHFCEAHDRPPVRYSIQEPDMFWLAWHRQGMSKGTETNP